MAKCKKCGGTGFRAYDLKSDQINSILLMAGIDFEIACECPAGKAELEAAKQEEKRKEH